MKSRGSRNSSSDKITRKEALELLKRNGCSDSVIRHVSVVSDLARSIAVKIRDNGHDIDVDFVETAALLHDIGRCGTHGISHGLEGARILAGHPGYASVCRTHIGAGITKDEAGSLGLPPADYLPETLEEKVIAHADNLVHGDRVVTVEESIRRFGERLGRDHPAVARVRSLADYIEKLSSG